MVNRIAPPVWRESLVGAPGAQLAVFQAGSNDPDARVVVLLHGLGHWSDAAWGRLVPFLDPSLRYLAFDLPGFGASEKPDVAYDLAYFRGAIDGVAAAYGIARFAIIGHSLGGLIAAEYAGANPNRVTHLGLLAPAGFARTARHIVYGLASNLARGLFMRAPSRQLVTRIVHRSVLDPTSLELAVIERAFALSQELPVRRAFASVYSGAVPVFAQVRALRAGFARYTGPVFCAWGAHDRFTSVSGLREVARVYPQAHMLVLARSGHQPMVEEPQAVGAALRAFLA